jgi:hypothetical protein
VQVVLETAIKYLVSRNIGMGEIGIHTFDLGGLDASILIAAKLDVVKRQLRLTPNLDQWLRWNLPHKVPANWRARRREMSAIRRKHQPAFKAKVALAALRGVTRLIASVSKG